MTAGLAWALVAAVGFGFLQAFNRKSNQLVDAFRTAFGLLAAVEVLLLVARAVVSGEIGLVTQASWKAVVLSTTATFFVVVALVPLMFREPFERMNLVFGVGPAGMLAGSILVVEAGRRTRPRQRARK